MTVGDRLRSDFAIVGGGLAGLSAAVALRAAGAAVTVLEARDRVGGRVLSAPADAIPASASGRPPVLDLGAQWVGPGQSEVLRWIRELGLHVRCCGVRGDALWQVDGQIRRGRPGLPPLPPRALAEVIAGAAAVRLMARQVDPAAPWRARRALAWDRRTAADWIDARLRTPQARGLAAAMIRGNAAIEPREASVLSLLFDLRSVGPVRHLRLAETFQLREGTHEIAVRLAARLPGRVRLGAPVSAITQDATGVTVASEAGPVRCRRVAVCVPPPLAAKIAYAPVLPEPTARLLAGRRMAASIKFHAVYPEPFWRGLGLSGQSISATEAVGLTYDNTAPGGPGVLVGLAVADAARRLTGLGPAARDAEIRASLGRLLGPAAARPSALVVQDWQGEEWTEGCYSASYPPGGLTADGPAAGVPCGRIHWAGTETSPAWYGYMEGALRSGRRAADEMLAADQAGAR